MLPDSRDKRGLQLGQRADSKGDHLAPQCAYRGFDIFLACIRTNTVSILEQRNFLRPGYQLQQHLHPFRHQRGSVNAHASEIAARPAKSGHKAICNRVRAPNEKNRNFRGCVFRCVR